MMVSIKSAVFWDVLQSHRHENLKSYMIVTRSACEH
jgi:hypothetical protein